MKRFRFNKIKWDNIISAVVVVALLVGCVAGLSALFNSKTTDVSDFNFKKGALDSAGFYVESDTSIYTKDLIECQGLVIEPDFEATGTYQVFYYGEDKNFCGSTEVLDAHLDGMYERGDTFEFAKYCRIVISPATPEDEDGYPVEDWKIHFWEVAGYADDYKITVDKKQNFKLTDYFVEDPAMFDKCYKGVVGNSLETSANEGYGSIKPVDVSNITALTTVYGDNCTVGMYNYFFLDASGVIIETNNNLGSLVPTTLTVPEGAVTFVCSYSLGSEFTINQAHAQ